MKTLEDTNYQRYSNAIQARAKVRKALSSEDTVEEVMRQVAEGVSLKKIAARFCLDYSVFHRMVNAQFSDQLQAARDARAEDLVESNLTAADEIQEGLLDPKAGTAAANIRNWYAERASSANWGQKSSLNVTHKGVVGLHLEAIRELASQPLEGEIEDAEFKEVEDEASAENQRAEARPNIKDHPLL